ncbi:PAS domain S-box protein [Arthrobacter sp. TPD3018]|nr:PAS domain S-box protein [Sphingomonas sp. TPD3009]PVE58650.1 PAS domain S-box protein [Arthrobacter sp. TPD3018]PVE86271.1 PAS domain S-box protein [Sphingomonas melonis]
MDTPRESAFDELAELVAAICEAPIGVVNLIGECRQFFKAEVGLGVRETPLDTSFCAHALLEQDFLLVPDATADPRFACNPLVTGEPHIRFYAGALLKADDGLPIGTLCVLDYQPRQLSDVQIRSIRVLARQVMAQLEQRLAARQVAASEARQRAIMDSAQDFAIVTTDLDGHIVEWTSGAMNVLGWSRDEVIGKSASILFTDVDINAGRLALDLAQAHEEGRASVEHWMVRKDGRPILAVDVTSPLMDQHGQHVGYVKVLRDRTEAHAADEALREVEACATDRLQANEEKWRTLFKTLEEGFILAKVVRDADGRIFDWRYEEVNDAWYDLVGIERGTAIGKTIRDLFPGIEDVWVNEFAEVVGTGEAKRFTRQVGGLDRWYDGVCQPVGEDRFTVIFLEVTDRIRAERKREALTDIGHVLSEASDMDHAIDQATEIVAKTLGVVRAGYGTLDADGEMITVPEHWTADGCPRLVGQYRVDDYGDYAIDLRAGRPVVIPDVRHDPRTSPRADIFESLAVRTMINLPVVENGRTVAIFFVNDNVPRQWTTQQVAFVAEAASRIRVAIERRRAEQDLRESESFMRSVLAASTDCIKVLNLNGDLTFMSDGGMKVMEISDFNAVKGCFWPSFLKNDGVGLGKEALAAARAGRSAHFEIAADTFLGTPKFWSVSVSPIFGENGEVVRILSVSRDHTTLQEAREQQLLLNGELSHRLKNVLAIVQSIANQTLRDAVTLEDASAAFSSRLASLGRATDVLTATSWEASDLDTVLEAGLAAVADKRDRIAINGPAVHLNPQSALALTLAIHELVTNALKYGALSNHTGTVTLTWEVSGSDANPEFTLLWQERDGPIVSPPARRGFGTRLIERSLRSYFRGETVLSYPPEGVEFRIKAPLAGAGELVTT